MNQNCQGLSKHEVQQYHDNGWIGPLTLISELEMAEFRKRLDIEIFEPALESKTDEKNFCHNRHLDNATVYQLLTHPNLAQKAESILGPDIVLWRSNFQLKLPLSQQDEWDTGVPRHQDSAYFQPSPNVILSAWIAIDHVEKSNGCMQILSGSHKKLCPHIQNDGLEMFEKTADIDAFEPNNSIFIELNPGEFIFFDGSILHSSLPNKSETRRLGISPRLTVPFVNLGARWSNSALMLTGKDYMGNFDIMLPPSL